MNKNQADVVANDIIVYDNVRQCVVNCKAEVAKVGKYHLSNMQQKEQAALDDLQKDIVLITGEFQDERAIKKFVAAAVANGKAGIRDYLTSHSITSSAASKAGL